MRIAGTAHEPRHAPVDSQSAVAGTPLKLGNSRQSRIWYEPMVEVRRQVVQQEKSYVFSPS